MSVLAAIDTALQFSSGADYEGAAEDHAALLSARDTLVKLFDAAQDALFALGSCEEAIDADRGFGWSIARLAAEGEAPEYAALLVALAEARGAV